MASDLLKKVFKNIFAILGFVAPIISGLGWKYNTVFVVFGLLLTAIIHLIFMLNDIELKKYLKVKGRVPGDGIYKGCKILKIEHCSKIPNDGLLTLVTKGSGISNAICILKIIESSDDNDIQAIQIFPSEDKLEIQDYFVDMNKLNNLYATLVIKNSELEILKFNENETV